MIFRIGLWLCALVFLIGCSTPQAQEIPSPTADAPTASPVATAAQLLVPSATSAPVSDTGPVVYRIVPGQSQVSYEVGETFLNENNRVGIAVGRTQEVNGAIQLDLANPQQSTVGPIEIDISTFASDNTDRDDAIRQNWLESARFPLATFVPTTIEGLPSSYNTGDELRLTITGDLTIRDVTKPAVFQVVGKLENEQMMGSASSQILMSDFGFTPPEIAGILRAEDTVTVRLLFVALPEA